jgi:hypothetical protein
MKPESFQNKFCREAISHHDARFSLTLTLSPEEREKLAPARRMAGDWIRAAGSRKNESIQSLFPLLRGEGQGEGKTTNQNSTLAIVL